MNSSNSKSPSPVRERRRTPMACTNCRSRKLKVSKPSKVSCLCSHYPSVAQSNQLIVPLVNDVSKTDVVVNIVPSTQAQPRTTRLLIIQITLSSFTLSIPLLPQTKIPLCPYTIHSTLTKEEVMYPTQHSTRPCSHLSRTHITQHLRTSYRRILYNNILIRSLPDTPLTSPTTILPRNFWAIPNILCHTNLHTVKETDHSTTGKNFRRSSNTW